LHDLRPKNENIGGKKPFCEKISSLGWFFDLSLRCFRSNKSKFSKIKC